jgi:hypothetical protein
VGTCKDPAYRQFDFWLGDWEVRNPGDEIVGHNRIRRTAGGCGLREQWRGRSGLVGTSVNTWSVERGVWHQTWIDSAGTLLLLEGGLRDDAMVLEGTTVDHEQPGGVAHHRISWSVVGGDPDRVRQHWQTSADGVTWETAFDGRYFRITR